MIKALTIQTFNFVLIIFSDEVILGPQRIRLPTVETVKIFFGRFKGDRDFRFVRESGVGVPKEKTVSSKSSNSPKQ